MFWNQKNGKSRLTKLKSILLIFCFTKIHVFKTEFIKQILKMDFEGRIISPTVPHISENMLCYSGLILMIKHNFDHFTLIWYLNGDSFEYVLYIVFSSSFIKSNSVPAFEYGTTFIFVEKCILFNLLNLDICQGQMSKNFKWCSIFHDYLSINRFTASSDFF